MDAPAPPAELQQGGPVEHRLELFEGVVGQPGVNHGEFGGGRRIADREAHHEAVELGLGQRKGALRFQRILRRQNDKGIGEPVGLAVHRNLPFLHALEQARLCSGRRAVDFVGEQDLRENRTGAEDKAAPALVEIGDAGKLRRQQVGGELNALEVEVEEAGQGLGECRLSGTWHILQQNMSAGQNGDDEVLYNLLLAEDDAVQALHHHLRSVHGIHLVSVP